MCVHHLRLSLCLIDYIQYKFIPSQINVNVYSNIKQHLSNTYKKYLLYIGGNRGPLGA